MDDLEYFAAKVRRYHRQLGQMQPFYLVINLSAPVALNHPWIALDGLLAHLQLREVLGDDYYLLPAKLPLGRFLRGQTAGTLPLQRTAKLWHASVSHFEPDRIYLETIYKRFEDKHVSGAKWIKSRIYQNMGYYRAHMLHEPYSAAHVCHFWGCGDIDAVARLLRHLVAIGNDTRIGFGAVRDWRLDAQDIDESIVRQGRANRPIPITMLKRWEDEAMLAWRPPYWAPECVARCAVPGSEVEWMSH